MLLYLIACIGLLFLTWNSVVPGQTQWQEVHRATEWLVSEKVSSMTTAPTALACVQQCSATAACRLVQYNENSHVCQQFYYDNVRVTEVTTNDTVFLMRNIKAIMAVDSQQKYKYTFAEAGERCRRLGSTLMTWDEMTLLQQDGLQRCRCGWFSNGLNGFPMQERKPKCGNKIGMITCNKQTAEAWCVLRVTTT